MEQGSGYNDAPPSGSVDKSRVLDVKPLRCLAPVFPSAPGMSSVANPHPSSFVCVPPTGPFPPGIEPFYPFLAPNAQQNPQTPNQSRVYGFTEPIPSPVPLNSFGTPTQVNGDTSRSRPSGQSLGTGAAADIDGYGDAQNQNDQCGSGFNMHSDVEGTSTAEKQKGKSQKRTRSGRPVNSISAVDVEAMADNFIQSFQLSGLDQSKKNDGDKDLVGRILMVFDLFRKRLSQTEESTESASGVAKRPDLRASATLFTKGVRTNNTKRIGIVPGVDVGDIFFFRMELCLVGLHAQSMGGIDYMSVKLKMNEEPLAVSIVSSGGYDDEGSDGDVLVYSGQGGVQRKDGQVFDQKLERGNLALEKSLHRANEIRVIRGVKDPASLNCRIYVYDGLYKIQESWIEKNKSGCNVFKYKLFRVPGQPEAFKLWKAIQQWKDGISSRIGVILPDLTSGAESPPVSLVNEVDDEKSPAYFTYITSLKYSKPPLTPKPSSSCDCMGGCQPGDSNCPCVQRNGGFLPYTSLGVLMSYNSVIHECGQTCPCPPNCRNRMSQAGFKVRLEVFKTKNRGWGLRSWDPIRAGGFICEYAGEVIDASRLGELSVENDYDFIFDTTRIFKPLGPVHDAATESAKIPFPLVINSRNSGNVARFMNHSCSPNVYWQPVVRENNDESCYHVAFFAIRHIPPMQELTFDYGMVPPTRAPQFRKKCFCGSSNCREYVF